MVLFCVFAADAAESYSFVTMWPELPQPWYFNDPSDVAVDASGNVYIGDRNRECIQKFTRDGIFITKWGSSGSGDGEFNGPRGVAVDAWGNVYVADTLNNRIQKFTSDGAVITKWGRYGSGDG